MGDERLARLSATSASSSCCAGESLACLVGVLGILRVFRLRRLATPRGMMVLPLGENPRVIDPRRARLMIAHYRDPSFSDRLPFFRAELPDLEENPSDGSEIITLRTLANASLKRTFSCPVTPVMEAWRDAVEDFVVRRVGTKAYLSWEYPQMPSCLPTARVGRASNRNGDLWQLFRSRLAIDPIAISIESLRVRCCERWVVQGSRRADTMPPTSLAGTGWSGALENLQERTGAVSVVLPRPQTGRWAHLAYIGPRHLRAASTPVRRVGNGRELG